MVGGKHLLIVQFDPLFSVILLLSRIELLKEIFIHFQTEALLHRKVYLRPQIARSFAAQAVAFGDG